MDFRNDELSEAQLTAISNEAVHSSLNELSVADVFAENPGYN